MPAFMLFSDAALRDMSARKPQTPQEFLLVNGVGQRKLELYGDLFLSEIRNYCLSQTSPASSAPSSSPSSEYTPRPKQEGTRPVSSGFPEKQENRSAPSRSPEEQEQSRSAPSWSANKQEQSPPVASWSAEKQEQIPSLASWPPEEDYQLQEEYYSGITITEMALVHQRPRQQIHRRLKELGLLIDDEIKMK